MKKTLSGKESQGKSGKKLIQKLIPQSNLNTDEESNLNTDEQSITLYETERSLNYSISKMPNQMSGLRENKAGDLYFNMYKLPQARHLNLKTYDQSQLSQADIPRKNSDFSTGLHSKLTRTNTTDSAGTALNFAEPISRQNSQDEKAIFTLQYSSNAALAVDIPPLRKPPGEPGKEQNFSSMEDMELNQQVDGLIKDIQDFDPIGLSNSYKTMTNSSEVDSIKTTSNPSLPSETSKRSEARKGVEKQSQKPLDLSFSHFPLPPIPPYDSMAESEEEIEDISKNNSNESSLLLTLYTCWEHNDELMKAKASSHNKKAKSGQLLELKALLEYLLDNDAAVLNQFTHPLQKVTIIANEAKGLPKNRYIDFLSLLNDIRLCLVNSPYKNETEKLFTQIRQFKSLNDVLASRNIKDIAMDTSMGANQDNSVGIWYNELNPLFEELVRTSGEKEQETNKEASTVSQGKQEEKESAPETKSLVDEQAQAQSQPSEVLNQKQLELEKIKKEQQKNYLAGRVILLQRVMKDLMTITDLKLLETDVDKQVNPFKKIQHIILTRYNSQALQNHNTSFHDYSKLPDLLSTIRGFQFPNLRTIRIDDFSDSPNRANLASLVVFLKNNSAGLKMIKLGKCFSEDEVKILKNKFPQIVHVEPERKKIFQFFFKKENKTTTDKLASPNHKH